MTKNRLLKLVTLGKVLLALYFLGISSAIYLSILHGNEAGLVLSIVALTGMPILLWLRLRDEKG